MIDPFCDPADPTSISTPSDGGQCLETIIPVIDPVCSLPTSTPSDGGLLYYSDDGQCLTQHLTQLWWAVYSNYPRSD
ncbi:MAG: hypothetical protein F6K63_08350 [Moorea sp. SIO1G6]|uniref:hypothetical protein n=1 Tax=Moorena sp. SIO1G6 TaxID=2607840 RepID=UPI0013C25F4F|nr:hypothetical protein [Moorena sp. SIO1G6]NET64396.1 hypothetical protein [Moorena sp. SIO1G6]